eukprot:TRINITY_DN3592_c0_g1_i13.p1 TRINITY_DN3592_c0_g1~~TRINITY_DN3592_c0_g1_i13.p1  ORF type:complete len:608 (-),score=168.37 TRINITY_DN3592_c0_g1_i13:2829-4484(-)
MDEQEVIVLKELLFALMSEENAITRLRCLLITHELFVRSKLFRNVVVEDLKAMLDLYLDTSALPPPPEIAKVLKPRVVEYVHAWFTKYGGYYQPLRVAHSYMERALNINFAACTGDVVPLPPGSTPSALEQQQHHVQELLLVRFFQMCRDERQLTEEIDDSLRAVEEECAKLTIPAPLTPSVGDSDPAGTTQDDGLVCQPQRDEQFAKDLQAQGLQLAETSTVGASSAVLCEFCGLVACKFVPLLDAWRTTLTRLHSEEHEAERGAILHRVLDLRTRVLTAQERCKGLGAAPPSEAAADVDDDGTEFVEDTVGTAEINRLVREEQQRQQKQRQSPTPPSANVDNHKSSSSQLAEVDPTAPTRYRSLFSGGNGGSGRSKHDYVPYFNQDVSDAAAIANTHHLGAPCRAETNEELLARAPVVKSDTFLFFWDKKEISLDTGLELSHRFYGTAEPGAHTTTWERLQPITYKPKKKAVQRCNAPTSKGILCPRTDLEVCPFHGPIIPRDEKTGAPLASSPLPPPCSPPPKAKPKGAVRRLSELDDPPQKRRRKST